MKDLDLGNYGVLGCRKECSYGSQAEEDKVGAQNSVFGLAEAKWIVT